MPAAAMLIREEQFWPCKESNARFFGRQFYSPKPTGIGTMQCAETQQSVLRLYRIETV
jgi:hypothetical protein